jgi:hypothetical protein
MQLLHGSIAGAGVVFPSRPAYIQHRKRNAR